ncbi:F0F1 ATP synthase subunit epsilon [Shimia sp. W99]|jgi:F-type H+-transporting ATPase subunit epsilon|uniref:ATP synthase epsilon chain n=1 Tax=Shimia aestuarii TaxID=254406 RepID=A0A1I4I3M9_9RHOB|nr:F0F1 ATP synthase subunit epsilon [Shimia aestuarii]SFL48979.1 ATP synthase F1 subcomplex epsilon subunit [Shimia aestuarii]
MANTMQFDLVSPERSLASLEATSVQIPGADGDMTAMPGHAPTLTSLRPGVVKVQSADGEKAFVVTRGFAEISAESISVIAEHAHVGSEVTKADLEDVLASARKSVEDAASEDKDAAEKFVADLVHLMDDMD